MTVRICKLALALVLLALWSQFAAADSGESALPGNHPLTPAQAGELLISELRCAACHSGLERDLRHEKAAPDLSDAGSRISPEYLQRYLASPLSAHSGTTMPDMLAARPEAERAGIAVALTHFLVAQSMQTFHSDTTVPADLPDGKELFHSIGCVACHGPREVVVEAPVEKRNDEDDEDRPVVQKKIFQPIAVKLGHVAAKYSAKSLSEFLFQPLKVRSSGRMPDMKLTPAESQAIARYLVGEQPPHPAALVPQESLVAKGKQHFQELNCAACHALSGIPAAAPVMSLKSADLARGCLSKDGGRSPQFHLADAQTQAIVAALRDEPQADSDQLVVAKSLTSFRCIACHIRDDFGGVPEEYSSFFTTSELKMGDDGRIPPPLTLLGAKLQPVWLKKVLFDGESVRPYMATRMPQYGTANLAHLPEVFARLDVLESVEMNIPNPERGSDSSDSERERERTLRKAGQELLGDKGLGCINCHNFNGKPAPVNKGMDLMTMYQRLQPGYFNRFCRNPATFRPRIIMPTAWPNGVASHKTILDGNTDQQIEAIWYYLSLGTSAADPSGIHSVSSKLQVSDQARTFRGRSRVAGFRGIAIGLPDKLNYAFNAETGTLSALWRGDFIGVNWNGQGSGDFNPASQPIALAQDVSFAQLADDNAPWPLMPVMTKEAKVNPNPLYPKNVGYQFGGYFLGEDSIPTFMYRSGTIQIEDRSVATGTEEQRQLKRVLQFDSPTPQTVWFRVLTGEISLESERVYRSGQLRLTIPAVEFKIRDLSDEPKRTELLLRLQLPPGRSTQELLYEHLDK